VNLTLLESNSYANTLRKPLRITFIEKTGRGGVARLHGISIGQKENSAGVTGAVEKGS
jgi:hypothetical protein